MMKPCQTLLLKKAPKKVREKETMCKDQSSGKQRGPKEGGPQGGKGITKY
jgi:hypothetical protein